MKIKINDYTVYKKEREYTVVLLNDAGDARTRKVKAFSEREACETAASELEKGDPWFKPVVAYVRFVSGGQVE